MKMSVSFEKKIQHVENGLLSSGANSQPGSTMMLADRNAFSGLLN
jgi:hypothetical protein